MKFPYAEERFITLRFENISHFCKGNRSIFIDKKESIQGLMRKRLKKAQTYYEEKDSQVYVYKPYSLKDRECKPVTRQTWDYEKSIKLGCIYLSEVKTKSFEIGKIDGYFTQIELCSLSIPGLKKTNHMI